VKIPEINRNESLKLLSAWEKKVSSPDLNEFYLDSFLYDRPHFQKNDPSYLKLIESTEPKNEQNLAAPKLFS
jgi:hypothetical protein